MVKSFLDGGQSFEGKSPYPAPDQRYRRQWNGEGRVQVHSTRPFSWLYAEFAEVHAMLTQPRKKSIPAQIRDADHRGTAVVGVSGHN